MNNIACSSVDEYIAAAPEKSRPHLRLMRTTIREEAPDAEECISYKMPAYKYKGVLVYFAAFNNHIGFYATPTGHNAFKKELAGYKTGKGSVQFPYDEPLPLALIRRMVIFRVKENEKKKK